MGHAGRPAVSELTVAGTEPDGVIGVPADLLRPAGAACCAFIMRSSRLRYELCSCHQQRMRSVRQGLYSAATCDPGIIPRLSMDRNPKNPAAARDQSELPPLIWEKCESPPAPPTQPQP